MQQLEYLPSTRYQGSKRKLLPALQAAFAGVEFDSAADPFCGSGMVSYLLKNMNKRVVAADALQWNVISTSALLGDPDDGFLPALERAIETTENGATAGGFIEQHFDGLFFTREENRFIDHFTAQLLSWPRPRRLYGYYALFQSALAKRPYNLFHRANLYMRQQKVKRTFGNKTTWDTPFSELIRRYARELQAAQFAADHSVSVVQQDVSAFDFAGIDLVYLDPPYMPQKGTGVDYLDYYHLLEGIAMEDNDRWKEMLQHRYKHKPLVGRGTSPWCNAARITDAFESVISQCGKAAIVISYRSDGIPDIDTLEHMLRRHGKRVTLIDCGQYVYALSKNASSREVILVGQ